MALFNNHKTFAGNFFDPMGLFGFGKKKKAPTFQFQPYTGMRPPRIGDDILRGVQNQDYDITMRQSRGEDVGFSPERRTAAQALLESTLNKQREDDVRSASGRLAASGLSGNLRAQEALTGRVNRDYGRTLGEQTNVLNIEDMTRAADDRRSAIDRLANLNRMNFSQENNASDFDRLIYGMEENNRRGAFNTNEGVRQFDEGQSTSEGEGWGDLFSTAARALMYTNPATAPIAATSDVVGALNDKKGGGGIAQYNPDLSFYQQPLRKTGAYRALVR